MCHKSVIKEETKTYLSIIADTNCANSTFHSHPLMLICELQGCRENRRIRLCESAWTMIIENKLWRQDKSCLIYRGKPTRLQRTAYCTMDQSWTAFSFLCNTVCLEMKNKICSFLVSKTGWSESWVFCRSCFGSWQEKVAKNTKSVTSQICNCPKQKKKS